MIEQEPPKRKPKLFGLMAGYTDEIHLTMLLSKCVAHGRKYCEKCCKTE